MALIAVRLCLNPAPVQADTPPSQVMTQPTATGQPYLTVPANGEQWIDVGGFCKVVDVGDLSSLPADAQGRRPAGIPIFDPGSTAQWENWRSIAPSHYSGALTSTTCCRPQNSVATLCAAGTNQTPVSREYGKLGETDQISATCDDGHGATFIDTVSMSCSGDNGADGQAAWQVSGDTQLCTPNAWTGPCNATCPSGTGTRTVFDSCNNPQATQACSISCCTTDFVKTGCNGPNEILTDVGTCQSGSIQGSGGCTLVTGAIGFAFCTPHSRTTVVDGFTFFDCGCTWVTDNIPTGCSETLSGCTSTTQVEDIEKDIDPQGNTLSEDAGPDQITCFGTIWE